VKHHEDSEQALVFEWASYYPRLRWMFAIANGSHLAGDSKQRAMQMARLKKQGLTPGVSDIFLPLPQMDDQGLWSAGLFIEMKRRKVDGPSRVSWSQFEFQKGVEQAGYKCVVCYGADEAIAAIQEYLEPL
jgi:hypothetical protein